MPFYDYEHCGNGWTKRISYDSRDTVTCDTCNGKALRKIGLFFLGNVTHVADNYKNIEFGTGIRGIETHREAQAALKSTGTEPVEAYYRPPPIPKAKEITLEEMAPYLDNMPLDNTEST